MTKKKQYLIYVIIIAGILSLALLIMHISKKSAEKRAAQNMPTLIGTEETVLEENPMEIGMTALETTPDQEDPTEEIEDRVIIHNMSELADSSLSNEALVSLQDYLTDYMNYYWDTDDTFDGVIVEDSYKDDFNLPSFHVYIEEIDLDIECIYHTTRHFYYMYSRLNPEE